MKEKINKEFNELWHSKWYLEELGSPSGDIKQFIYEQIDKVIDELLDDESLEDESNGRYNREMELRKKAQEMGYKK